MMASSMEHSDEFDFSDWLIKALETNLTIDENFNNFASNIYESINLRVLAKMNSLTTLANYPKRSINDYVRRYLLKF